MKKPPEIILETIPAGVDPHEYLRQVIHDCPECRAALAAGEVPIIETIHRPRTKFPRPARWRTQKKTR